MDNLRSLRRSRTVLSLLCASRFPYTGLLTRPDMFTRLYSL